MNFQLLLNMSDRGWLETTYYQLGSDYRGNLTYLLSYMSQMGGWSILDYALHFAKDPTDTLRLGYASSLSSWALVNSGTAESRATATGSRARRTTARRAAASCRRRSAARWIGKEMTRGAWHYSAEEDVGYAGALRSNATIVARDPVFGEFAYGGVLTRERAKRQGRAARRPARPLPRRPRRPAAAPGLDHDGFAKEQPVVVADDLSRVQFVVENRAGGAHETGLSIGGLPAGEYSVSVDGREVTSVTGGSTTHVTLPVSAASSTRVTIARSSR